VLWGVLDINLGDGSGIELRHRLAEAAMSLPVTYITGNDSDAMRMAAMASSCIVYLTKPFSAQSLSEYQIFFAGPLTLCR
jgi:FixJ family two-component response regulator